MRVMPVATKQIIIGFAVFVVCTLGVVVLPASGHTAVALLSIISIGIAPGFVWSYALFRHGSIEFEIRIPLGIVLSIIIVAAAAYGMNGLGHQPLTRNALLTIVTAATIAGVGISLSLQKIHS